MVADAVNIPIHNPSILVLTDISPPSGSALHHCFPVSVFSSTMDTFSTYTEQLKMALGFNAPTENPLPIRPKRPTRNTFNVGSYLFGATILKHGLCKTSE